MQVLVKVVMVPKVSIIIVNYNSQEMLRDCLSSIFGQEQEISFEVIVADNCSTDSSLEMIESEWPQVSLVKNTVNAGFARANNQAIERAVGEYVLLLNPDTLVLPQAIKRLSAFLDRHSEAAAVGAKLLNRDGSLQFSMRNFPTVANQLSECFFLHRLLSRVSDAGEMITHKSSYAKTRAVEWLCGACIMMRRQAIDEIGLLDEDYFLFVEETDWFYRAHQAGWRSFYYPEAEIVHFSGDYWGSPQLSKLLIDSRLIFFKKHAGWWRFHIFKAITIVNLAIRASLWFFVRRFAGGTAERRSVAYASGLRAAIRRVV